GDSAIWVTSALDSWVQNGQDHSFVYSGDETAYVNTWKDFSAVLNAVYDTPAPMTTAISPGNDHATNVTPATVVTDTPTLSVNAVTDADGDTVQYLYRVASSPDAESGTVWDSG